MQRYSAILTPDPVSGFVVEFPDLPCGITQGESVEACLDLAADIVIGVAEELLKRHEPLPRARRHRGPNVHPIALPAIVEAKLALHEAFRESGLSKSALGKRLGGHPMQLDRLFDLRHASRMEQVESALHALGKRLVLSVEDAA